MRRTGTGRAAALLAVAAACASPGAPHAARRNPCAEKVHVESLPPEASFAVIARNDCHVPVEVTLDLEDVRNLEPSREPPVVELLAPGRETRLLEFRVLDPSAPVGYRALPRFRVGGPASPDPGARYAFPFGGREPRRLSQGVGGAETHTGLHRFAFDFEMPIGTPVLAARPGVVFEVMDGFGAGARGERWLERGNGVVVRHDDGTFALYGHLRKGVCAREGQALAKGDLLGWSGNSGYTSGPHLHFEVGVLTEGAGSGAVGRAGEGEEELESIPILFEGEQVPAPGALYPPQPAGGGEPERGDGSCD